MKDALAIHRMLLERETLHEIVRLPHAIANADELPSAGLPVHRCLATRVFAFTGGEQAARGYLAAVIVAAGGTVGTEPVRLALGARTVRPARADLINTVTEFCAELVCPLMLPESMAVLIDHRLTDRLRGDDVVYTATGEPWTALGVRVTDLNASCGAEPVDLRPIITSAMALPLMSRRPRRATW
jgi:prolyl-tRNA editing enzyme YbaK/EbsC (Cys-tRNA(Pro) deacylase)